MQLVVFFSKQHDVDHSNRMCDDYCVGVGVGDRVYLSEETPPAFINKHCRYWKEI